MEQIEDIPYDILEELRFYRFMFDSQWKRIQRLEKENAILYRHIRLMPCDTDVYCYEYQLAKTHFHSLIKYLEEI